MLIYSMSVSVDGFIADRDGAFGWRVSSDERFRFHLEQVRGLGSCLLGRRLCERPCPNLAPSRQTKSASLSSLPKCGPRA
jgi:hypothetical protein